MTICLHWIKLRKRRKGGKQNMFGVNWRRPSGKLRTVPASRTGGAGVMGCCELGHLFMIYLWVDTIYWDKMGISPVITNHLCCRWWLVDGLVGWLKFKPWEAVSCPGLAGGPSWNPSWRHCDGKPYSSVTAKHQGIGPCKQREHGRRWDLPQWGAELEFFVSILSLVLFRIVSCGSSVGSVGCFFSSPLDRDTEWWIFTLFDLV